MRKPIGIATLAAAALIVALLGTIGNVRAATAAVYDDSLHWDNWSWGTTVDTNATAHVREGTASMAVTYNQAWAGLQLRGDGLDTSPYARLRFNLHSDGQFPPAISVALYEGGTLLAKVDASEYRRVDGDWWEYDVPLADLNAEDTIVTRLQVQDRSGGAQPTFYVDDMRFAAMRAVTFDVTTTAADDDASPGDGVCETASGECSLQAAVQEINALPSGWFEFVTIVLPAGTYRPDSQVLQEGSTDSYRLLIPSGWWVRMVGAGIDQTIIEGEDAESLRALIMVDDNAQVHVGDLTLDGLEHDLHAVINEGDLSMASTKIVRFDSRALLNLQSASLGGVSIVNNSGGAIENSNNGTMVVRTTEIQGNAAPGDGGGITQPDTSGTNDEATIVLEDTVISDNIASGQGGGIFHDAGSIALRKTSVVNNGPNDCNRVVEDVDTASSDSDGTCIPAVTAHFVYDDELRWANWSWNTFVGTINTSPVYAGVRSMDVTYRQGWAGLSFHGDGLDTSDHETLRFGIHTNGESFPNLRLIVHGPGGELGRVDPRDYDGDAGDGWRLVSVPLEDLNAANTAVARVTLQEATGSAPPTFYIDNYGFFGPAEQDDSLTFDVTTTAAEDDANPGDGVCETASGECSLQGAVQEFRALSASAVTQATVTVPAGTYAPDSLMWVAGGDVASRFLIESGDLTIVGDGAADTIIVAVDGGLEVSNMLAVSSGASLVLEGVTLRGDGFAQGAIFFNGSDGDVEMVNSDLIGFGRRAIYNFGRATFANVTIADNTEAVSGASSYGAGILNWPQGTVILRNSRVQNNFVDGDAGGIENRGSLIIEDSIISDNTATDDGGGIYLNEGTVTLRNSSVVDNGPNDCSDYVDEADAASSDSDGTCIPPEPETTFIYDDGTHWANWSWNTAINPGDTDPIYGGDHSMLVTFNGGWAGLSFHDGGFDTSDYETLRFAIHTSGASFPVLRLVVHGPGGELGRVDPRSYDGNAGDGWRLVVVPLADLGASDTTITRVTLQDYSGSAPPSFNIDSYGFWSD